MAEVVEVLVVEPLDVEIRTIGPARGHQGDGLLDESRPSRRAGHERVVAGQRKTLECDDGPNAGRVRPGDDVGRIAVLVGLVAGQRRIQAAVRLVADPEEGDRRQEVVAQVVGHPGVELPVRQVAEDLVRQATLGLPGRQWRETVGLHWRGRLRRRGDEGGCEESHDGAPEAAGSRGQDSGPNDAMTGWDDRAPDALVRMPHDSPTGQADLASRQGM